ncbi:aspartyl protease [Nitzschia inconspicua]|uniref:Aspartyl protease n=1 Tax=Nitzschia inconspicua TaxID=303405 RepID=A0A9K3KH02_9STRA|nr:aspartyl protease [Nitzschia inconspicua]
MGAVVVSLVVTSNTHTVSAFVIRSDRTLSDIVRKRKSSIYSPISSTLPAAFIRRTISPLRVTTEDTNEAKKLRSTESLSDEEPTSIIGVVAPLHHIGPYTCLRLQFPEWKDDSEEREGEESPSFDFMIDTGANVNSIDARLVEKYRLAEFSMPQLPASHSDIDESVLSPSALIGATTSMTDSGKETPSKAGTMHWLGTCQLAGLPPPNVNFLRNLVAASLPFASPVGVGILGLPFLWAFPAGVELDWHGTDGDPPTIIFFYGNEPPHEVGEKMVRVPIRVLMGGLMTLDITVNNVKMRALLDTGSPLTVLNKQACNLLGSEKEDQQSDANLGVKIVGVDGSQSQLHRLKEAVSIHVLSYDPSSAVALGEGHVWSGPLAGIELIRQLDDEMAEDEPAAVLGLDFLQNAYRMVIRAPKNEVWFEELPDGFERKYA